MEGILNNVLRGAPSNVLGNAFIVSELSPCSSSRVIEKKNVQVQQAALPVDTKIIYQKIYTIKIKIEQAVLLEKNTYWFACKMLKEGKCWRTANFQDIIFLYLYSSIFKISKYLYFCYDIFIENLARYFKIRKHHVLKNISLL